MRRCDQKTLSSLFRAGRRCVAYSTYESVGLIAPARAHPPTLALPHPLHHSAQHALRRRGRLRLRRHVSVCTVTYVSLSCSSAVAYGTCRARFVGGLLSTRRSTLYSSLQVHILLYYVYSVVRHACISACISASPAPGVRLRAYVYCIAVPSADCSTKNRVFELLKMHFAVYTQVQ